MVAVEGGSGRKGSGRKVSKKAIKSARSLGWATVITMSVPGTRALGPDRNRSRLAASQVRWEACRALEYPKLGREAAGRPMSPANRGPCPVGGVPGRPEEWQSAQFC